MAAEGSCASIVGDQRGGGGEWGTPDVVGWYLSEARSLLLPIRRVAAVEVKLVLSRAAIAQAASYRRFAHYVYVAVPQVVADVSLELRGQCGQLGIGIMCKRQSNSSTLHVLADANFGQCDEEAVEALLQRIKIDNGTLDGVIAGEARRLLFAVLAQGN